MNRYQKRIVKRGAQYHDKLVLAYLNKLDEYKGHKSEETEELFKQLSRKWMNFCEKHNLDANGYKAFESSIENLHKKIEAHVESKKNEVEKLTTPTNGDVPSNE